MSASRPPSRPLEALSKTRASLSTACFFQIPIKLGRSAYRLASSAMVCSPRMASRATLALNSAVYSFCFDITSRPFRVDRPYPPVPFPGTSSVIGQSSRRTCEAVPHSLDDACLFPVGSQLPIHSLPPDEHLSERSIVAGMRRLYLPDRLRGSSGSLCTDRPVGRLGVGWRGRS